MVVVDPPMTTGLARRSAVLTSRANLFQSTTVFLLMPNSYLQNLKLVDSLLKQ